MYLKEYTLGKIGTVADKLSRKVETIARKIKTIEASLDRKTEVMGDMLKLEPIINIVC